MNLNSLTQRKGNGCGKKCGKILNFIIPLFWTQWIFTQKLHHFSQIKTKKQIVKTV